MAQKQDSHVPDPSEEKKNTLGIFNWACFFFVDYCRLFLGGEIFVSQQFV